MRTLLALFLLAAMSPAPLQGDETPMPDIKASLLFREVSDPTADYPHVLNVYLCLENQGDSDTTWFCNPTFDTKAELLDAKGKPVPMPPSMGSVASGPRTYMLPYGSRLEWLLSHEGVSLIPAKESDLKDQCAVIVGEKGWLIPRKSLSSYSLRLRVRGSPVTHEATDSLSGGKNLLFEVPPTPLVVKQ